MYTSKTSDCKAYSSPLTICGQLNSLPLATHASIARCNNGVIVVSDHYIFQSSYLRFKILMM
jgi:hypothetical protein